MPRSSRVRSPSTPRCPLSRNVCESPRTYETHQRMDNWAVHLQGCGAVAPNLSEHDLLIVSDLHLSEGRDPDRKEFSRKEDFFSDEEFARFLAYHKRGTPDHPRELKWHLIINGDFLDFLQVTRVQGAPCDLIH